MAGRPCDLCGGEATLFGKYAVCDNCKWKAIEAAVKNKHRR